MKRKITAIMFAGLLSNLIYSTVYAESLTIDGLTAQIPDTWVEIEKEITDDSTQIEYTCGDGAVHISAEHYDESLADMSYILIDSYLYAFKNLEGYTQYKQFSNSIDGRDSHATIFTYQGNTGMLVSVDTGVSIANFMYICPTSSTDGSSEEFTDMVTNIKFSESSSDATDPTKTEEHTKYVSGMYKIGTDMPAGEYVVFAESDHGYFCVSPDSNQNDITFNENFDYNSIFTVNDGEYLELSHCYAIPIEEDPELNLTGTGMFKVGLHIPAGEYKLEATNGDGYYCIYPDSRQQDITSNNLFEGQNYVTVNDGQYLVLDRCKFMDPPEKPIKTYTDADTVKKVQEALNAAGYDCGTPDGVAGSGTKAAIEKYQTDKSLSITGSITDELLESLGI